MTPEDVAAILAAKPPPAAVQPEAGGLEGQAAAGSGPDDNPRTADLGHVLRYVGELHESGSETLDLVAQKIGDGSRDASWRLPLGRSGLLDFFAALLAADGLRPTLAVHALRVIGNSCADTDENRARVVASDCLPRIVQLLCDDALVGLAIPVLYNTCVDYEPAQTAVYKAGLNPELVRLLSGPRRENAEPFLELICKLLELIATQEPEENLVHPATPFTLLGLATAPAALEDGEDFLSLTSVALAYLSHERFQQSFLETPRAPSLFMAAFSNACLQLDAVDASTDMAAQVKKVRTVFMQSLADLSAHPLFAASCPIDGPDVKQLRAWLSSDSVPLQSGACLALGNIARSDATCTALVQGPAIHEPLAAIVANPAVTDAQLLHSVLGFLKNLAIPAANKPLLGSAGLLDPAALPRIWAMDTQVQVQFGAVSLTRLLATSCLPNVQRLCTPFPNDDDDDDAAASASDEARTPLQRLVGLVKRSDQAPTQTEAARAVGAVLRVLHSDADAAAASLAAPKEGGVSPLRHFYAAHAGIPEALGFLATQDKFPVLRSELWFVLALISRSPEGAECAALCLQRPALAGALRETVLGRDGSGEHEAARSLTAGDAPAAAPTDQAVVQQLGPAVGGDAGLGLQPQPVDPSRKADMARKDRENALVLVAELLQRHPEKLADLDAFKEMLRTGGQMVIDERAAPPAGH